MTSVFSFCRSIARQRHACVRSALLLVALTAVIPARAAALNPVESERTVSEYEVKAAYVYNFAKFVEWPPTYFSAPNAPITIGVIGDEEFAAILEKAVKNKLVQEHSFQVRHLKWPIDLGTCNLVYVPSNEQKRFRQIAEGLQDKPVLTITEVEEKSQAKGIMNLFIEGGKVQFEVNIADAEKAKLRISSKLLRLARGTIGNYSGKGE
jgi:hypothetical protein